VIYCGKAPALITAYRQSIWMICPSFYWVSWDYCCLCFSHLAENLSLVQLSPTANFQSPAFDHYQINNNLSSFHPTATIPKCGGCHEFILDRFILKVSDRTWHAKCLQCNDCHAQLNEKCFIRNGQLFCKDDFFKWVEIKLTIKRGESDVRWRDWFAFDVISTAKS
jgi:hypothetical protein